MTLNKFSVLVDIFKERLRSYHRVLRGRTVHTLYYFIYQNRLCFGGVKSRTERHKYGCVFGKNRMLAIKSEGLYERASQCLQEVKRSAQKKNLSLYLSSLRKACHGLLHHGVEYGIGNIRLCRALIYKRLYVRFCEHAASRGDRISPRRRKCKLIHLVHRNIKQRRHLVDKRARAAGTATVHSLLCATGDKDDFCILAAKLHTRIGIGVIFFD